MSDLLEETNQDYQYERNLLLFKKFLPIVIIITILFIILFSIRNWYNSKELSKIESRTEILVKLLKNEHKADFDAKSILNELAKENDNIGDMAKFELAVNIKDKSEQLLELEKLANNSQNNVIKSLVKLRYIAINLDSPENFEKNKQKIQTFLISFSKNEPLFFNAKIFDILYNIKINNITNAKEILNTLNTDRALPETIKGQLEAISNYIKNKEINEK